MTTGAAVRGTLAQLTDAISPQLAVDALERALRGGLDPEEDGARFFAPAAAEGAEFLISPSVGAELCGVKVLTVAPGNPLAGHPTIQGVYLLFDARSSAAVAVIDGAELTLARTAATTALAVKHLVALGPESARPRSLIVFGSGPQAHRHVETLAAVVPLASVTVVGRRAERVAELVDFCAGLGVAARSGSVDEVTDAELVLCASSSPTPLFDGALVRPDAIVAAIGAHGLDRREVDEGLVLRADVVVEGRASAVREAGELAAARTPEEWARTPPANLAELLGGGFRRTPGRPALYKSVGMGWQDLVVADAVYRSRVSPAGDGAEVDTDHNIG